MPEQVSLFCVDADPGFACCKPTVAHVRWAATVSRGGQDMRQTLTPAEFVAGGKIGPVRKE